MSNEKIKAGRRVAAAIGASERNVNASIVASAQLLINVVQGCEETGEPATAAQEAVSSLAQGIMFMSQARSSVLTAHESLVEVRDGWNIPPNAFGCNTACLPTIGEAKPPLSVVDAA